MSVEIVLYRALASRAFPVLWLLQELGLEARSEIVSLADWRRPERLRQITPSGKVPAIVDGETVVTEAPAICLYLADRYGYGALAPKVEEPDRGPYLKWMVWSTAVLEPARELQLTTVVPPKNDWGVGWPAWELVLQELAGAVEHRQYLLGDRFSAADVMVGSVLSIGLFCEMIPPLPALVAYNKRLATRPANQRAGQLNWPPDKFPAT
ncbi:MAG TPA: glutathione S-transferase family protein [Caulobacteraceae bacterium]|jgi:glutathione S-transferase|nr:glutathione S-transferase family protein [Caulobacteraceae bacterium]